MIIHALWSENVRRIIRFRDNLHTKKKKKEAFYIQLVKIICNSVYPDMCLQMNQSCEMLCRTHVCQSHGFVYFLYVLAR